MAAGQRPPTDVMLLEGSAGDAERITEQLAAVTWAELAVRRCKTSDAAIASLRKAPCELILIGAASPEEDPLEMVRSLQLAAPAAAIVVLSAPGDGEEARLAALRLGAQDSLPKADLDGEALSRALRYAVTRAGVQRKIQSLVMSGADATIVASRDGIVRFANPAAERLFGRAADDLIGELFGFPLEKDAASEIEIVGAGGAKQAEMRMVETDWEGEASYLLSLRDVTDRKRAQDLQARLIHADRLASIGQLAAGVAHEVNNPAAFVLANLSFMEEELKAIDEAMRSMRARASAAAGAQPSPTDARLAELGLGDKVVDLRELVRANKEGVERIARTVRQLMGFSRIEREEVESVDVNEVLDVACNITFNELRHRARLVKDFGLLPPVPGNRGKLSEVFTNLVLNAVHAIKEGAADENTIRVTSRVADEHVVVSIEDTGHGIPESIRSQIFDPFFTTKPREQGTGLGLPLSAEIVRKHGGDIRFERTPDGKTVFHTTLPVHSNMAAKGAAQVPSEADSTARPQPRARVLLIDDEGLLVSALARVLSRENDVVTAVGGARGLEILMRDASTFDVIICDLMMPDTDGVGIYNAMQEHAPEVLDRIIFYSGGAFTPRVKSFISTVRNICLEKPIAHELLMGVVARVATASLSKRTAE